MFLVRRFVPVLLFVLSTAWIFSQAPAPMVNPDIDQQPGPFSYYSHSVDEIGVMDAPQATEITPEGSLYTGYGELLFLTGPEMSPIAPRIRTLEQGYIPVLHTQHTQEGVQYSFTFFTAKLDDGTLVNFARVVEKNVSDRPTRAALTAATRYQNDTENGRGTGEHRFVRPVKPEHPGDYSQPGVDFNPDWVYSFSDHAFLRSGKVFYFFPDAPDERMLTEKQNYNQPVNNSPRALHIFPTTLVGLVSYDKILAPGAERTITFLMPLTPLAEGAETEKILKTSYDAELAATIHNWEKIVGAGMQISVSEPKVNDTFRASLVYDLLARDHIGNDYIQTVNKLHYHSFYLRDASDIVNMYDLTGYSHIASQDLAFFPRFQRPDGLFLSQPEQYDAQGQVLWVYGQHYLMTHNLAFARRVFPSVERAVDWLDKARASDPLHLIPASNVKDNEYVEGHITGYNLLALGGLKNAAVLANAVGEPRKAADYLADYSAYRKDFLKALSRCTAMDGGYIPPSLDGDCGGQDWGNLMGTYPEHVFAPDDPLITATLKKVQSKYQEGLTTYGDGRFLHDYLIMKNTLTEIVRNEQQQPVKDLYALLLHTSSTQEGFEFAIRPWGSRDFDGNLTPHGWFAAEFRLTLRDMMVREDEGQVHLLTVMSPAWMGAGKIIRVERAPTEYGMVSFTLTQPDDHSARIDLQTQWTEQPKAVLLHLPWFAAVSEVLVDGKPAAQTGGVVRIPADAREVLLKWTRNSGAPDWSYNETVQNYEQEYRRRYEIYMHGGASR
ncbi:MAG TPA: hypothetical protein VGS10_23960 [Terracidiphilus sp.]|nr:hypothetical protein [Terracidiphilus sp.]